MNPAEFRARYDDLTAGFIGWKKCGSDCVVLWCNVANSAECPPDLAWLAAAGRNRHSVVSALKAFGVHGLKLKGNAYRTPPPDLVVRAVANIGAVVAVVPEGNEKAVLLD